MKSLQESLLDDEDKLLDDTGTKTLIKKFIKDHYRTTKPVKISKDFIVDCDGEVFFNDFTDKLTNGLFKWGKVAKGFFCTDCLELTSLEGGPEEVGGNYNVAATCITSLEGAPKKVGGYFDCSYNGIISLEGAPKEVGENFDCSGCKGKFTEADVKKYSKVKGKIYCKL